MPKMMNLENVEPTEILSKNTSPAHLLFIIRFCMEDAITKN